MTESFATNHYFQRKKIKSLKVIKEMNFLKKNFSLKRTDCLSTVRHY